MKYNNLIFINGGAYTEIKKALNQWIALYSDQIQSDLNFKLYKNGKGNHIVQADERLDNDKFFYLVNYLKYPEGIEYIIEIEGYTTGEEKVLKSKKLLVYISPNDKEYDNVFVTTEENENYKVDFGGKVTVIEDFKTYRIPQEFSLNTPETLKVKKREIKENGANETDGKIYKRFKVLSILVTILFFGTIFFHVISNDDLQFQNLTFYLGLGIWLWFFSDYEMLRIDKLYFRCIFIATSFSIYGIWMFNYFGNSADVLMFLSSMSPLTLLILQRPIRKLYIKHLKREPKIDNHGQFADLMYSLFLMLSSIILPMIIRDYFK